MKASELIKKHSKFIILLVVSWIILGLIVLNFYQQNQSGKIQIASLTTDKQTLSEKLKSVQKEYEELKSQDQVVINKKNQETINNIETTYKSAVATYEKLLDLKTVLKNTSKQDELFTKALTQLSEKNFADAKTTLATLTKQIDEEKQKVASTFTIPANVPVNNAPPGSGYSRQQIKAEIGTYLVDIVSADLASTRVIVDTASDASCSNDCPVLALGDYVSRNGAFAGINGSYFCPASYPSCAGKTNSFDTLLMNKNKVYFNSDNNVYSNVPAVIFGGGWIRFVGRSLDWGRDTGIDGMIANQPLLLSGGNITFGGDGDPKKGGKGSRSFVANKGNTVYIGVAHNATVAEVAYILKAMGMENGLNLDSGGSTALWSGGYKAGPGRNIPNAILFVKK